MLRVPTPVIDTERLVLRPLAIADAEATQRLFPQWEIVRHMNDRIPWPYPLDGALTFIRTVALPAVARGEAWFWSLRLKTAPDELIGQINLRIDGTENRGFWLGLPWQGQGLMTEASEAVDAFWFRVLRQDVLRVSKAVLNVSSRRVSQKNGMRVVSVERRNYVCGPLDTGVYEITRKEWEQRTANQPG